MSDRQLQVMVERIWLQGEEALIPILPIVEDGIRYQVPGIDSNLEIKDRRVVGRAALEAAATAAGAQVFHENFDSPALVTIRCNDHGTIVELEEPMDVPVQVYDVLWIAARVRETLPAWPTAWHFQSPPRGKRHSFVAILE